MTRGYINHTTSLQYIGYLEGGCTGTGYQSIGCGPDVVCVGGNAEGREGRRGSVADRGRGCRRPHKHSHALNKALRMFPCPRKFGPDTPQETRITYTDPRVTGYCEDRLGGVGGS